jgi:hypothetical protein
MQLISSTKRLGNSQIVVSLPALGPEFVEAETLYLVGHPNRSTHLRAFLVVNAESVAAVPRIPLLPGNVTGLQVDSLYSTRFVERNTVDPNQGISPSLLLVSDNEPAEIVRAVLGRGSPDDPAVAVAEGDTCCLDYRSKVIRAPSGSTPASYFTKAEEYGAQLTAALDHLKASGDPKLGSRYFFALLDATSNPTLGKVPAKLSVPISTLLLTLKKNRLFTRRLLCTDCKSNCSPWYGPNPPTGSVLRRSVSAVSEAMLYLMNKYLGDPTTDAGLALIEEAFEDFSNGGLRILLPKSKLWTTQPSSAFYFLFAEFAFIACDSDISASSWERIANVLVRTQEVFCNAYKPPTPPPGPPVFGDYGACHFCANKPYSSHQIAKLRASYSGLALDDLRRRAACNARTLFTT